METMKITIHDISTDTTIVRDFTNEEMIQHEKDKVEMDELKQKVIDDQAARISAQAKLAALGLTPEEISALVG